MSGRVGLRKDRYMAYKVYPSTWKRLVEIYAELKSAGLKISKLELLDFIVERFGEEAKKELLAISNSSKKQPD